MTLKPLAFVAAGCLIAVGAVVPVAGAIADPPEPVAGSTRIIEGTITTAAGRAFHAGTPVTLSALGQPDPQTGEAIFTEIASTTVAADGSFDLRADDIACGTSGSWASGPGRGVAKS